MKKGLRLAGMLALLTGIMPASGADIVSSGVAQTAPPPLVYTGRACARWDPKVPAGGAYYYGYCSNRTVPGYQVQRDTFYYYNGTTPIVTLKLLLTCYVHSMPARAQALYCP
jgi:hypothetical protein